MIGASIRPGDRFFVEPKDGERVEVVCNGLSYWGLVNGVLNIPCRRVDTDDDVIVAIGYLEEVEPL